MQELKLKVEQFKGSIMHVILGNQVVTATRKEEKKTKLHQQHAHHKGQLKQH